jgi:hypothetical protein
MLIEPVLLSVPPGIAPRTREGNWGLVMFHTSGKDEDKQWFDYRPSIYDAPVRAEWALGTMMATVSPEIAIVLVEHRYARVMSLDEAKSYNKGADRLRDEKLGVKLDVA